MMVLESVIGVLKKKNKFAGCIAISTSLATPKVGITSYRFWESALVILEWYPVLPPAFVIGRQ